MRPDLEIDATGLLCPLPVLRARKALAALPPGALLRVLADDPAARIDLPHFCTEGGHVLVTEEAIAPPAYAFLIRKGPLPA